MTPYFWIASFASLRRELHEIADALDEDMLRQEREGVNLDLLPGEIEREEVRQRQLLEDVTEASAAHHQAQAHLDALIKDSNAADAAVERAEANAELLSIAERWLLRAAASRLAARAIERHRVLVQDPLIDEAGKLLATATGDAFAGLGIDYGDDDQPILVARRTDDERVRVEGLSDGTRDQLFLALRLALLERRPSEPICWRVSTNGERSQHFVCWRAPVNAARSFCSRITGTSSISRSRSRTR
jgi:chromosome segregation protein